MNKEEIKEAVIARFDAALREQGWAFYCPGALWEAYRQGLLKSRYVNKYLNAVPKKVQHEMSNFLEGQNWEIPDPAIPRKTKEAAPLPEPTFTVHSDWKVAIAHCGLKGVGAGKLTKSRAYCSLYAQSDGISELVKIPIHFKRGYHKTPPDKEDWEHRSELNHKLERILRSNYDSQYGSIRLVSYLIIQTDFFSKERITKLRRRIEERLRKGALDDIIRVAKSLGVK